MARAKPSLSKGKSRERPRPKKPGDIRTNAKSRPRRPDTQKRKPLKRGEVGRRGLFRFGGKEWRPPERRTPGLNGWQTGRLRAHEHFSRVLNSGFEDALRRMGKAA